MSGQTPRFQLRTLDDLTDAWSADDYRFSDGDRHVLDALLSYVVELHRHSGLASAWTVPAAPTVSLATTGGRLPAGRTLSYQYTIVDARGFETAPSSVVTVTTPVQLDPPAAPTLTAASGSLRAGTYRYAVSYTHGGTTYETPASIATSIGLGAAGGVSVTLPVAPSGVYWNVYRLGPGDQAWTFLGTAAASPWTDDGTVAANALHQLPTANTIYNANAVTVTLPAPLAAGTAARIYRSMTVGDWTRSLLTETTSTSFVDTGTAPLAGSPPAVASIGSPPQVSLPLETSGDLPPGRTPVPVTVLFTIPIDL
jgi:hypothetical protein